MGSPGLLSKWLSVQCAGFCTSNEAFDLLSVLRSSTTHSAHTSHTTLLKLLLLLLLLLFFVFKPSLTIQPSLSFSALDHQWTLQVL